MARRSQATVRGQRGEQAERAPELQEAALLRASWREATVMRRSQATGRGQPEMQEAVRAPRMREALLLRPSRREAHAVRLSRAGGCGQPETPRLCPGEALAGLAGVGGCPRSTPRGWTPGSSPSGSTSARTGGTRRCTSGGKKKMVVCLRCEGRSRQAVGRIPLGYELWLAVCSPCDGASDAALSSSLTCSPTASPREDPLPGEEASRPPAPPGRRARGRRT